MSKIYSTEAILQDLNNQLQGESLLSSNAPSILDNNDVLKKFQDEFLYPDLPIVDDHKFDDNQRPIYLCGNSLGLQPKNTISYVEAQLKKWSKIGVDAFFKGEEVWMDSEVRLNKILSKIVGAKEEEICSMNTLSVNLHLMMVSFYKPTETRFKILVEKKAFPSDYHVIATQLQWHGLKVEDCLIEVETSSTDGSLLLNDEDIKKAIYDNKDSLALVLLSGVQYYTGQFFNIPEITKYAQEHGAIVGWDLAHAVGNIPLKLNEWNVDFACWCSYKYLNSGPGALAGIYVNERYCQPNIILDENTKVPLPAKGPVDIPSDIKFPRVDPLRLGGWWGHRVSDRFVMDPAYLPINGAPGFRLSNPAPTLVATLRASLELFDEAGIERLREKSVRLNAYLEYLLQQELSEKVTILTPKDPNQRGCQFSLSFSGTSVEEVHEALTRKGITGDVRKPNVIRVSPTPMYNSFQDVYEFVQVIKSVLL